MTLRIVTFYRNTTYVIFIGMTLNFLSAKLTLFQHVGQQCCTVTFRPLKGQAPRKLSSSLIYCDMPRCREPQATTCHIPFCFAETPAVIKLAAGSSEFFVTNFWTEKFHWESLGIKSLLHTDLEGNTNIIFLKQCIFMTKYLALLCSQRSEIKQWEKAIYAEN